METIQAKGSYNNGYVGEDGPNSLGLYIINSECYGMGSRVVA